MSLWRWAGLDRCVVLPLGLFAAASAEAQLGLCRQPRTECRRISAWQSRLQQQLITGSEGRRLILWEDSTLLRGALDSDNAVRFFLEAAEGGVRIFSH